MTAPSVAVSDAHHPIGPKPPKSVPWNPVEIVYCQLTMTDPSDPSTALFNPANYVITIPPGASDPVGDFVKLRLSDPSAPVAHDKVYTNTDPNKGPCDVFVENQCYFVIETDETLPWQFCTSQPCITLKGVYQHGEGNDDNFGLTLDATGRFASWGVAIRSGSPNLNSYVKEAYNIVLETKGQGQPTIYVIDPDSTNQNDIPPSPPPP